MTGLAQSVERERLDLQHVEHVFQPARGAAPLTFAEVIAKAAKALESISGWPGFNTTPLRELALAPRLNIASVIYKDESPRFGLNSFKAMGAGYALLREVARMNGLANNLDFVSARQVLAKSVNNLTVACATDGNHGRAVAWAANLLRIPCVVFLPRAVSPARAAAIRALGAETRRIDGTYDEAVQEAARKAALNGWHIISDTAYADYEDIPRDIMQGYTAIGAEIHEQRPDFCPTHIFAQAGVGGLAASIFAYFAALAPGRQPINVVVEPVNAACLFASARARRRTGVAGDLNTIMAGLACGEPSTLAWRQIEAMNCHFLAISDQSAEAAMRLLADPHVADSPIIAGESGAAGLAGLLCAALRPDLRAALDLSPDSRVLLIGTEGATDPAAYQQIIEGASRAGALRGQIA